MGDDDGRSHDVESTDANAQGSGSAQRPGSLGSTTRPGQVPYPASWKRHARWAMFWAYVLAVCWGLLGSQMMFLFIWLEDSRFLIPMVAVVYLAYAAGHLRKVGELDVRRPFSLGSREAATSSGLWIPLRRSAVGYRLVSSGFWGAVGLGGLLFLVLGYRGEYRGDASYYVAVVLLAVLAGWGASYAVATLRRVRNLGISVSMTGVHHHTSRGEIIYRWEHIGDVVVPPARSTIERGRGRSWPHWTAVRALLVRLVLDDDGLAWARGDSTVGRPLRGVVIGRNTRINVFDLDTYYPHLVPHLLRFYLEHPELRNELGTQERVDRIRTANFT